MKTVYPNEMQNVLRFEFSVAKSDFRNFLFYTKMKSSLNYSFEEDHKEFVIMEYFIDKYKDFDLSDEDF